MWKFSLAVLACAVPATAQESDIAFDEWSAMIRGSSAYYYVGETYIGREFYEPTGKGVRFQRPDGSCTEGTWTHAASTNTYCFNWPGSTVCARHVRDGDEILILPVDENGVALDDEIQVITSIQPGGFSCAEGLTS